MVHFADFILKINFQVFIIKNNDNIGLESFNRVYQSTLSSKFWIWTEGIDEDSTGKHLWVGWLDIVALNLGLLLVH